MAFYNAPWSIWLSVSVSLWECLPESHGKMPHSDLNLGEEAFVLAHAHTAMGSVLIVRAASSPQQDSDSPGIPELLW